MSDKQIVERNGVSMDRHSTTVGGKSPWKKAAARENEVPPFSYETVRITASANVPSSEVEAAKKAVLARYPMATSRGSCHTGEAWRHWIEFAGKNSTPFPTEDAAWISAASKLAPLTEDAPKGLPRFLCDHGTDSLRECPMCMAESEPRLTEKQLEDFRKQWHGRYINSLAQEVYEQRKLDEKRLPPAASPVGELEGEFEAALASKPYLEGIPERPKHVVISEGHTEPAGYFGYRETIAHFSYLEALLSSKDAERARLTAELKIETELSDKRAGLWLKEYERAEAAEAELSALKLSSARVRDEALRYSAQIASSGTYSGDYSGADTDSRDEVCRWISGRILSLIPTSPEHTEEGA